MAILTNTRQGMDLDVLRQAVVKALSEQQNKAPTASPVGTPGNPAETGPQGPGSMATVEQILAGIQKMPPTPDTLETENISTSSQFGAPYSDVGPAFEAADLRRPAPNSETRPPPLGPPRSAEFGPNARTDGQFFAPQMAPTSLPERSFAGKLQNFGRALQGRDTGDVDAQNATYQALIAKGLDATLAQAIVLDPNMSRTVLPSVFSPKNQVINNRLVETATGRVIADLSDTARQGPDVKEITLPNGDKQSVVWNARTNSYEPVVSTTPGTQPGTRPPLGTQTTETQQTGPNGRPLVSPLPVAPDTPETAPPPGVSPQAWRKELARKRADARSTAIVALPEAMRAGEAMLRTLDDVIGDRNLPNVTGLNARLPTVRPSSHDVEAKIAQIQGGTFLQAFNSLKGGGAISEKEGQAAMSAYNRLSNLRQSDAGYLAALHEFRTEVRTLMDIARRNAGQGGAQPAGRRRFNPQTGAIE